MFVCECVYVCVCVCKCVYVCVCVCKCVLCVSCGMVWCPRYCMSLYVYAPECVCVSFCSLSLYLLVLVSNTNIFNHCI